jgi:hypothetical protein
MSATGAVQYLVLEGKDGPGSTVSGCYAAVQRSRAVGWRDSEKKARDAKHSAPERRWRPAAECDTDESSQVDEGANQPVNVSVRMALWSMR